MCSIFSVNDDHRTILMLLHLLPPQFMRKRKLSVREAAKHIFLFEKVTLY